MKRFLRIIVPILLVFALIASSLWYLMVYDKDFTRDVIIRQARYQEAQGNQKSANWLYNLAYRQSSKQDDVAIELADFFLAMGNYTKAEFTLTNAIMDGGDAQLYVALARTFVAQGKFLDAVTMLDQITDPAILSEIQTMRPAAPVLTPEPGFYSNYITVDSGTDSGTLYINYSGGYPDMNRDAYTEPCTLGLGETTVYALVVADNGLVSPLTVGNYTIGGVVEPAILQDTDLEAIVRSILSKPSTSTIFTNELWDITSLMLPDGFTGWEDLHYFTGLKELIVQNTNIESLSFLGSFAKLEKLDLQGCRFPTDDLNYIAECSNLRELNLFDCGLSTISGLENAVNLQYLNLESNTLRNLSPLAGMQSLEDLKLSRNAVADLSGLSGLSDLKNLELNYNDISDLSPLATLSKLQVLELNHNNVANLSPAASLPELNTLQCAANGITDLTPLSGCHKLTTLDVSENKIVDLSPLGTSIRNLDFSHNLVAELPNWTEEYSIVNINGSYNLLLQIDALSVLPNLNSVTMEYNEIEDISALADCPLLIQVDVFGTKVADVKMLTDKDVIVHYDPTQGRLPDSEG